MKSSLSIVLLLELGFAVWLASTTCLLRPAFVHAIHDLKQHPASESAAAEFRHQRFLSEITPFAFGACIFGVLALPTAGMAALRRRRAERLLPRRTHTATPAA